MSGHTLLPGCTTPWRHNCPGRDPVDMDGAPLPRGLDTALGGGLLCHCPCHGLARASSEAAKELVEQDKRLDALVQASRALLAALTEAHERGETFDARVSACAAHLLRITEEKP